MKIPPALSLAVRAVAAPTRLAKFNVITTRNGAQP
jgi:hypothetical protein